MKFDSLVVVCHRVVFLILFFCILCESFQTRDCLVLETAVRIDIALSIRIRLILPFIHVGFAFEMSILFHRFITSALPYQPTFVLESVT